MANRGTNQTKNSFNVTFSHDTEGGFNVQPDQRPNGEQRHNIKSYKQKHSGSSALGCVSFKLPREMVMMWLIKYQKSASEARILHVDSTVFEFC